MLSGHLMFGTNFYEVGYHLAYIVVLIILLIACLLFFFFGGGVNF